MKKLKTTIPNGGAPFGQWPVLREIFDIENKDAIEAILNSVLDGETEGVILSGCTVSGTAGNFAISSGFIYADGEVLRYAGGTGFSATQYLKKATVTEEGGVFADSVTRNYIDVNEATEFSTSGGGSGTQYITVAFATGGRTLSDLFDSRYVRSTLSFADNITDGTTTNITYSNNTLEGDLDDRGVVRLQGSIDMARSGATGSQIDVGIMPSNIRPNRNLLFACGKDVDGVSNNSYIFITSSTGVIATLAPGDGTTDTIYLDGITFVKTV